MGFCAMIISLIRINNTKFERGNLVNNIESFTNEIIVIISEILGDGYRVEKILAGKKGIIIKNTVAIDGGMEYSPILYVDNSYNDYLNGIPMDEIAEKMIGDYEYYMDISRKNMPDFNNIDEICSKIFYKLLSYENNKEKLDHCPHIMLEDLAVAFYVWLNEMDCCNFIITNEFAEGIGLEIDDIIKHAKDNTPLIFPERMFRLTDMIFEIYESINRDREEMSYIDECVNDIRKKEDIPMYVLTNKQKYCGAGAIMYSDLLYDFCVEHDTDAYILPSSIHELIIVPCNTEGIDANILKNMVREVNSTILKSDEILSDNVYLYSRCDRRIKRI